MDPEGKPAFAQSLGAMYGSSSETSEDEDDNVKIKAQDDAPRQEAGTASEQPNKPHDKNLDAVGSNVMQTGDGDTISSGTKECSPGELSSVIQKTILLGVPVPEAGKGDLSQHTGPAPAESLEDIRSDAGTAALIRDLEGNTSENDSNAEDSLQPNVEANESSVAQSDSCVLQPEREHTSKSENDPLEQSFYSKEEQHVEKMDVELSSANSVFGASEAHRTHEIESVKTPSLPAFSSALQDPLPESSEISTLTIGQEVSEPELVSMDISELSVDAMLFPESQLGKTSIASGSNCKIDAIQQKSGVSVTDSSLVSDLIESQSDKNTVTSSESNQENICEQPSQVDLKVSNNSPQESECETGSSMKNKLESSPGSVLEQGAQNVLLHKGESVLDDKADSAQHDTSGLPSTCPNLTLRDDGGEIEAEISELGTAVSSIENLSCEKVESGEYDSDVVEDQQWGAEVSTLTPELKDDKAVSQVVDVEEVHQESARLDLSPSPNQEYATSKPVFGEVPKEEPLQKAKLSELELSLDAGTKVPEEKDDPPLEKASPPEQSKKQSTSSGKVSPNRRTKHSPSPEKVSPEAQSGRRVTRIRHPSAKAAEAAADAAFMAAVTPTRTNLKEAKIACAIANVTDKTDMALLAKKQAKELILPSRLKRGRSASLEPQQSPPNEMVTPSLPIASGEEMLVEKLEDKSARKQHEQALDTILEANVDKLATQTSEDVQRRDKNDSSSKTLMVDQSKSLEEKALLHAGTSHKMLTENVSEKNVENPVLKSFGRSQEGRVIENPDPLNEDDDKSVKEESPKGVEQLGENSALLGTSETDSEKPVGIKLKISKESVKILDQPLKKLEVQIPSDGSMSEASPSPGGTRRVRKLREETSTPPPPLSPILLKISKSKDGLEVVPSDQDMAMYEPDTTKLDKLTLKLPRDSSVGKPSGDEVDEGKLEKITLKLAKDVGTRKMMSLPPSEDCEATKLEKITLKLSKDDGACIIKKKEDDYSPANENEGGKLEKITLKRSVDNNVSIVRSRDSPQPENVPCIPSEGGKLEKITLKVSKNESVCILKPSSPVPSTSRLDEESSRLEKITLKMSKDGTAAVSGKSRDDSPSSRDSDSSKLEKITLKLSRDEGVSIVKPASPGPERITLKLSKEEPLSPLSPLVIGRYEEGEPQKERITLKLSKAGGYPSPVGVVDERSSWSIKSTDSDNAASPVSTESSTPKSKPKRALSETPESGFSASKRLKMEQCEESDEVAVIGVRKAQLQRGGTLGAGDVEGVSALKRPADDADVPILVKRLKVEEDAVEPHAIEVIELESEDSKSEPPSGLSESTTNPSTVFIDLEEEIPTSVLVRKKPRGRPRKAVLTPGAVPVNLTVSPSTQTGAEGETSPKSKRVKVRVEPVESDRPKRSCKGREKPPPKPVKHIKPRGKAATLKHKQALAAGGGMKLEGPQLFEEETRMSADCGSRSHTPGLSSTVASSAMPNAANAMIAKVLLPRLNVATAHIHSGFSQSVTPAVTPVVTPGATPAVTPGATPTATPAVTPAPSPGPPPPNEESQGSLSLVSSTTTESTPNKGNRKGRMEIVVDPDAKVEFTVDMIAEYSWPITEGRGGETFMIQEQISEFLGVKSFKRKYPNMQRRTVDHDERQYLRERKLVSEGLCDLGLTAVPSHEVLDVMCVDFPEKYDEYRRYTREKVTRELSNKQKAMLSGGILGKEDSKSKAIRNMASYNSMLNRSRRDQRRCFFDLQNFNVLYPEDRRKRMVVPNVPRIGHYPLALVPGQYTDYYKQYTATELRYFPLNTVLYGPLLPHEMMHLQAPGGSDGSQTDTSDSSSSNSSSSDSDSSGSDSDSDSNNSSGSEDDESSQPRLAPADSHGSDEQPDAICRICNGDRTKNKAGHAEALLHCANCQKSGHPSCLDLTIDMVPHVRKYAWHCTDCKLCAQCNDTADEDKMLFCDMCDRGYHIYCVGLRKVPEGRWHCRECALCASCGARDAGGTEEQQAANQNADTPSKMDIPQWQHEFKRGEKNKRVYVRTLCVPCSKLWRKGRFCRLCWKCYGNKPEEEGLINCSVCDRWMHADCCRKAGRVIDVEKLSSFLCELCQQKGYIPASKTLIKPCRP